MQAIIDHIPIQCTAIKKQMGNTPFQNNNMEEFLKALDNNPRPAIWLAFWIWVLVFTAFNELGRGKK